MEAETQLLHNRFLQGVYPFEGRGLEHPYQFTDRLHYEVPADKHAQLLYFRAGNSSVKMIYMVLMRNNNPDRYFPIGAKAASHVTIAITDDMQPGDSFAVYVAAPKALCGWVVLDMGLIEF